jgi:hypothetical protein
MISRLSHQLPVKLLDLGARPGRAAQEPQRGSDARVEHEAADLDPRREAVPAVVGDERLLKRLARNALENAFSFASKAVSVKLESTGRSLKATILDDGTGTGGTDNDTPTLSVSNVSVTEGTDAYATFSVSLSNASTQSTSVSLALGGGTATGTGTDYGSGTATNLQVSTDGGTTWTNATTATIAAGSTSVLVRTPIINDALDEANETFSLTATRTAGTPVTNVGGAASGTATITDDDPTPSLSINSISVNEATGTATFTVTLSAASGQAVTVGYSMANGSATSGSDYTAGSGTLTFAAGVTSQTISVPILQDTTYEGSETFTVTLASPAKRPSASAPSTTRIAKSRSSPAVWPSSGRISRVTGSSRRFK